MRTHHHHDTRHSLTVCALDAPPEFESGFCPMDCGLNFISLLESADISFGRHVGPLSLKCAYGGEEMYETEGRRLAADDSRFLILNDGRQYSSAIERPRSMESFCVWFRSGFAEEVSLSLRSTGAGQLDDPRGIARHSYGFFERTYPHDSLVSPVVERMRTAMRRGALNGPLLEEMFHDLMERMLALNDGVRREVNAIPALRASTKEELYRRLHRCRDHIDACASTAITLTKLAEVAELSPHYLLRMFKQMFGETPREYQSRLRMERARGLLLTTDAPITQICFGLGYESLGSFSWDFRRRFGASPSAYRKSGGSSSKKAS